MDDQRGILFSFGLITDIQYADIDDRRSSSTKKWRRYRNALVCLEEAVAHWKGAKCSPSFIVQLGDIIDGFNSSQVDANDSNRNFSKEALDAVMKEFSKLPREVPVLHNLGNHELYNFSREELTSSVLHPFNCCQSASYLSTHQGHATVSKEENKPFYFSFTPHPKFCFIYLDSFEVSIHGVDNNSARYQRALEMVCEYNKNEDLESCDGLKGLERRFVEYNGAISTSQLSWLNTVLKGAQENGQKAVVFSHVPIYPGNRTQDTVDLLWNYKDVLKVLWQSGCVVACFHGHSHEYDHAVDENGIHHYVFNAVIEAPLDSNAFAMLHVKDDSIVIEGFGVIKSQELQFSQRCT